MKTYNELISRWDACRGGQILVDHQHPIKNMYLNINEKGNRELLIPVPRPIKKFKSTEAIGVINYKNSNSYYFAIELLIESLIKEYACLCFELIQSSKEATTQADALNILFQTFQKWYELMASVHLDILSMQEIRGLMGEIRYMIEKISSGISDDEVIAAWTTHKDASRDFIFDDTWSEIKTIQSTSDYITISSLDQLDHDMDGSLVVYRLDRAPADGANTYTLNSIVKELRDLIGANSEATLNRKLLSKGYVYNEQYDNYSFSFNKMTSYLVDGSFPRICRSMLPAAISAANYDILLSGIDNWRVSYGKK